MSSRATSRSMMAIVQYGLLVSWRRLRDNSKTVFVVIVLLIGTVFLLLKDVGSVVGGGAAAEDLIAPALGTIIGIQALLITLIGFNSSRMPVALADIPWFYALPLSWRTLIMCVALQRFIRFMLYYFSFIAVAAIISIIGEVNLLVSPKVFLAPVILVGGLALLYTSSGTRGSRVATYTSITASILTSGVFVFQGVIASRSDVPMWANLVAESIGLTLLGEPSLIGWACILWFWVLGILLIILSDSRLGRNQAIMDAQLWGDMTFSSFLNSKDGALVGGRIRSMQAGGFLRESSALFWAEIASLRRQRWNVLGFGLTAIVTMALVNFDETFARTVLIIPALQFIASSWSSGTVAHMRAGSFNEAPGSLAIRTFWSELLSVLKALAILSIIVSICFLSGASEYVTGQALWVVIQLLGAAICARVVIAVSLVFRNPELPAGLYVLSFIAALTGMLIISTSWAQLLLYFPLESSIIGELFGWLLSGLGLIGWCFLWEKRRSLKIRNLSQSSISAR